MPLQISSTYEVMYVFCGTYLPPAITVREKLFGIYFAIDSEGTSGGFNLTFKQIESGIVFTF